jgi:hypothetical protein
MRFHRIEQLCFLGEMPPGLLCFIMEMYVFYGRKKISRSITVTPGRCNLLMPKLSSSKRGFFIWPIRFRCAGTLYLSLSQGQVFATRTRPLFPDTSSLENLVSSIYCDETFPLGSLLARRWWRLLKAEAEYGLGANLVWSGYRHIFCRKFCSTPS